MKKPLVSITAGNTVIGFGEPQMDDAIGVSHGGLGLNYIPPKSLILGNNTSPVVSIGRSSLKTGVTVSTTNNTDTLVGHTPITIEVQEENILIENLQGSISFSRIGPGETDAIFEEAADDFGSYNGGEI